MRIIACLLLAFAGQALANPPPAPAPTGTNATASATSNATAKATGTAASTIGDVAPAQTIGGDSARSYSLFIQPPAFTPPMAKIDGCAPAITQSARSGWLLIGGASVADSKTDPTDCTLMLLRNAKVDACQYASAKQIEDLMIAKLLPDFKASAGAYPDLTPTECAAMKAPSKAAEVRYVSVYAPPECDVPAPRTKTKRKAALLCGAK